VASSCGRRGSDPGVRTGSDWKILGTCVLFVSSFGGVGCFGHQATNSNSTLTTFNTVLHHGHQLPVFSSESTIFMVLQLCFGTMSVHLCIRVYMYVFALLCTTCTFWYLLEQQKRNNKKEIKCAASMNRLVDVPSFSRPLSMLNSIPSHCNPPRTWRSKCRLG
jgi:purine-cytosine permease-like protein